MTKDVIDLTDGKVSFFYDDDEHTDKYVEEPQQDKLMQIHHKIITFLKKLKSDPKSSTIKWPSRISDIEKFEKELEHIIKG